MYNHTKINKKAAFEAMFWLLIIVATIIAATQFSWETAQSILQYILVISAGSAVYFYITNRNLYQKSQDQNKKLLLKQREISRFQKTVDLIFQNSADGILILNDEQSIESFSPGMEKISGYKKQEVIGRNVSLLKFQSSSGDSLLPDLMFTMPGVKKATPYVKNFFVSKDGKNIDIEASYTTVKGENGEGPKALAIIRDISYEKSLIDRDKEFIAVTSHQLNTPLSIIRGYSAMLSGKKLGELNQKQKEYVHEIHEASERMYTLTNNLLSISRIEQDKISLDPVDINIQDLFSGLETQYESNELKIKLVFNKAPKEAVVFADKEKIKQALSNLIDNAIKYTKIGSFTVKYEKDQGNSYIRVIDTGMGIAEEDIEKIGTRFFRSQEAITEDNHGTGLGVYITKSIVEKHGGELIIESKIGKGSTFTIKLPNNTVDSRTVDSKQ